MTTLTEEQIAEIRARAEAATPGPWRAEWSERDAMDRIVFNDTGNWLADVAPDDGDGKNKRSDALFIAHARTDIPALLSALEAANKRADEAEARRKCYECGSEMTACAQCNPELPSAELAKLSDPNAVHINMLRGTIAKPSVAQIKHLYGNAIADPAQLTALRARVAELEGALTEISKQTYGTEIWMDGDERAEILGRHLVRLRSLAFTALKGASHDASYEAAMWRPVSECPEEWKDGRSLLAERAFDGNYKTDLPTYFEVRWRTDGFNFTGFMDFQGRRINVARLRPLPTVSADYDDNVRRAKTQTFKPLRRPTVPEGE